jgi:hypothetical protein
MKSKNKKMCKFSVDKLVPIQIKIFLDNQLKKCEFIGKIIFVYESDKHEYLIKPVKIIKDEIYFLNNCMDNVLIKEKEICYEEPDKLLLAIL